MINVIRRYLWRPYLFTVVGLVVLLLAGVQLWRYGSKVQRAFGERNWSVPSRVYARPPELYPSKRTTIGELEHKLKERQYVRTNTPSQPGQYTRNGVELTANLRPAQFLDGQVPSRKARFHFAGGRLQSIEQLDADTPVNRTVLRLEPLRIGSFYSHRYEDWIPLTYEETPDLLRRTLIMVEDQRFREHFGLDIWGILRAMKSNILAGEIVQGGSTLTQQLVKNRFLGNQRTLWRKTREAVLALMTEWYFDKKTILQAYVNEAYLGQVGKKSVQGFGKASQYYFGVPTRDLSPDQIAMLVGLIRGPSLYNPRRDRRLARKRRNFILNRMKKNGLLSDDEYGTYRKRPLRLAPKESISLTPYPDFLDLAKERLRRHYRNDELRQRGLKVYTTLIPKTQRAIQATVESKLDRLNQRTGDTTTPLQTGIVTSRIKTGEITGLLGGRRIGYPGFNRALSPRRSVGSVIKPVVYLTALKQTDGYNLLTKLKDEEFSHTPRGDTRVWSPDNYNDTFHGKVPLLEALTQSYNVATARLGLDLGLPAVFETLHELGMEKSFKRHPALFLGSASLSPLQVTQMYQTLGGRGYHAPLKAVRGVLTREGQQLSKNPITIERTLKEGPVYTLNHVLRRVTQVGTARNLRNYLPGDIEVAGKTGTTQRYRDSWFAGFTRNRAMTVWIGHDDNSPTGLSGASGALQLWGDLTRRLKVQSIQAKPPESVELVPVDTESWLPSKGRCSREINLPFVKGSKPDKIAPCARDDSFLFF